MYKKITHNIVEEHFDHPAVIPVSMSRPDPMQSANRPAGWYMETIEDDEAIDAFESAAEKLWQQLSEYSRSAMISTLAGLEDTAAVTARLIRNLEDLGAAITPYYGAAAATALTDLLKNHINIAVDIFKAIKESRSTAELETAWTASAESIARFLSTADPRNWPYDTVLAVLGDYSVNTLQQARARFAKDWAADIAANDAARDIICILADTFSSGIVNKFPEAFAMQYSSKDNKKK